MSSWLEPLCCTRRGAAHRRRGTACQDASGWLSFQDRDGDPVQVMVVADGHGGARYLHSDVGSWLACRLALTMTRQLLRAEASGPGPSALQAPERRWQALLGQTLPRAIHQRWLRAVRKHWQSLDPASTADDFAPLLYGTTLGLVVMTPRWWGQTGLGDWDLLRVWSEGAQLLSEESDAAASGEATFSLCLPDAAAHFATRTAIEILEPEGTPFALVLSTDGIRKSCSTDGDFLALGRYLGEAPAATSAESTIDLDASLDRISSQGSGDDVSVALALWQPAHADRERPMTTGRRQAHGSRPQLHPSRPQNLEGRRQLLEPEREIAGGPRTDPTKVHPPAVPGDGSPIPATPAPARRRVLPLSRRAGALVIGGLSAVALGWLQAHWPAPTPEPDLTPVAGPQQVLEPLRRQVHTLCAAQVPIRSLLLPRRPTFQGLQQGRLDRGQLLAASALEPLDALIALSQDPTTNGSLSGGRAFVGLQPCPQLQEALRQLWIETRAATVSSPAPADRSVGPTAPAATDKNASGSSRSIGKPSIDPSGP